MPEVVPFGAAYPGPDTLPVQNAPGAEYVSVTDRKIGYMRIIFDSAPFEAARRAASEAR